MRIIVEIQLREVTKKDWDFILNLRNNDYKFFYLQDKPIDRDHHFKYMENQISNPSFHNWIITYENHDAGYVRILNTDVGIMIKNEFQNKGIATMALELVEKKAIDLNIKKLVALIDPDNNNSQQIFKKNGYLLKLHWLEKNFN
jgi:RimJ/RimL family protein N-acetyltransferase